MKADIVFKWLLLVALLVAMLATLRLASAISSVQPITIEHKIVL